MTQRGLAAIVLVGLIGFLYPLAGVIQKITSWAVIWDPPAVGEIVQCIVFGLVAVAGAMGLDVPALIAGFRKDPPA